MSHLSAFRLALEQNGFDAAILSSDVSRRYLTDFDYSDGLAVVTGKNAYLLTDFRYEEAAKECAAPGFSVLLPTGKMIDTVRELLAYDGARIAATEDETLSCAALANWKERLGGVSLRGGASAILRSLRAHKDEKELAAIARAQKVTDAAYAHILDWIQPEMTEIEVALELEFFMRKNGAQSTAFETIAVSGSNSSRPHGVPRPVKLEKGFLTMDFGARVDGYCSDMTRTVSIGKADAEMKKLYHTVLSAQIAALTSAGEGVSLRELDATARDLIDGAGYRGTFGHSLGHGVGLEIHEDPRMAPGTDPSRLFERGHVITFEPGIYLAGKYGCRIEDMACVMPDGTFFDFTQSPKELVELF